MRVVSHTNIFTNKIQIVCPLKIASMQGAHRDERGDGARRREKSGVNSEDDLCTERKCHQKYRQISGISYQSTNDGIRSVMQALLALPVKEGTKEQLFEASSTFMEHEDQAY